jgi:hypothetical protein
MRDFKAAAISHYREMIRLRQHILERLVVPLLGAADPR